MVLGLWPLYLRRQGLDVQRPFHYPQLLSRQHQAMFIAMFILFPSSFLTAPANVLAMLAVTGINLDARQHFIRVMFTLFSISFLTVPGKILAMLAVTGIILDARQHFIALFFTSPGRPWFRRRQRRHRPIAFVDVLGFDGVSPGIGHHSVSCDMGQQ